MLGITTAMIWALSCGFAMPYSWHQVLMLTNVSCPAQICMPPESLEGFFSQAGSFKTAEFLSFYFAPLLVIIVLYSSVIRRLSEENEPELIRNSRMSVTKCARRHVVKMLVVCVVIYFVCYSPVQIFFLANRFGWKYYPDTRIILVFNSLT